MKKILALVSFLVVAAGCTTEPSVNKEPASNANNTVASKSTAPLSEADITAREKATWEALIAAVHEEVQRLPDPLRAAFVLCDLEGVRQPDAAVRLGWKAGTLTGRLSRELGIVWQTSVRF